MTALIKGLFFLVLLSNSLMLIGEVGPFEVYTLDLALAPFAALVAIRVLMNPAALRIRLCGFDLLFLALFATMLVSFAFSTNQLQSLANTMDWARLVAIYFMARLLFGRVLSERTLAVHFGLMSAFLLVLGLLQMITGEPIGLVANYFGANLDQFGWSEAAGLGTRARVSGPTPNSNVFAMWVTTYGGLLLALLLARGRPLAFLTLAGVMWVVLVGTLSRGGVLGFLVFVPLLLWMNRSRAASLRFALPALVFAIGSMAIVLAMLATRSEGPFTESFRFLVARQSQMRDFGTGGLRGELMALGFELLKQPKILLVGCGADSMLEASMVGSNRLSRSPAVLRLIDSGISYRSGIHNVWMRTAVENGIFSALALLLLCLLFVRRSLLWRSRGGEDSDLWAGYLIAIAFWYLLVPSQVYLMAARLPVFLPIALLMALVVTRTTGERLSESPAQGGEPLPPPLSRGRSQPD